MSTLMPTPITKGFFKRTLKEFLSLIFFNPLPIVLFLVGFSATQIVFPYNFFFSFLSIMIGLILYVYLRSNVLWEVALHYIPNMFKMCAIYSLITYCVYSALSGTFVFAVKFSAYYTIMPVILVTMYLFQYIHQTIRFYVFVEDDDYYARLTNIIVGQNIKIMTTILLAGLAVMMGFVYQQSPKSVLSIFLHTHATYGFIFQTAMGILVLYFVTVIHMIVKESFIPPAKQTKKLPTSSTKLELSTNVN